MEAKLMIKMLGSLEVSYGDKVVGVNNSTGKSKKMWVLFEYLVINHMRKVPQSELIEILWPSEDVANPANSLKVLAFKLRQELDRLDGITGKEIVTSGHGTYGFNSDLHYEIDVIEFEKILEKAKTKDNSAKKKLKLLNQALDCFKGTVLSDATRDPWAASLQTHYNELYKSAVSAVEEILLEEQDYEGIISLCKNALLIQPFEENYYYFIIKAYAAQENYSAASAMYKQVQNVMQKEYGTTLDTKFEGAYKELMKERPKRNMHIEELTKTLEERTNFVASFFVEYGEFKQIYRYIARRLERTSDGAFMCLYTLGIKKGATYSKEEKAQSMQILSDALSFTLRQGDVFTRATPNQYAVIFTDITVDNAKSIYERVSAYFKKNRKREDFGILHSIAPIEPSDFAKKRMNQK